MLQSDLDKLSEYLETVEGLTGIQLQYDESDGEAVAIMHGDQKLTSSDGYWILAEFLDGFVAHHEIMKIREAQRRYAFHYVICLNRGGVPFYEFFGHMEWKTPLRTQAEWNEMIAIMKEESKNAYSRDNGGHRIGDDFRIFVRTLTPLGERAAMAE